MKSVQIYSNKCREFPLEFNKIVTDMCNVLLSVLFRLKCHWNILIVIVNILSRSEGETSHRFGPSDGGSLSLDAYWGSNKYRHQSLMVNLVQFVIHTKPWMEIEEMFLKASLVVNSMTCLKQPDFLLWWFGNVKYLFSCRQGWARVRLKRDK